MHIERERKSEMSDGDIMKGPLAGRPRWYRDALYSTLVHLKPKVCLEIGTYIGQSSHIFQQYFDKYMPDGVLVTCDVQNYVDLSSSLYQLPNVRQVRVFPHIYDIENHHDIHKGATLPFTKEDIEHSAEKNIEIIKEAISDIEGEALYDFCFLDGDHNGVSFMRDLQICAAVLKEPQYMLIDDTEDWVHACAEHYHMKMKPDNKYDFYDFADWHTITGCSLVWNKSADSPPYLIAPSIEIKLTELT
jgi:predicted O-methyltransferase YrrM